MARTSLVLLSLLLTLLGAAGCREEAAADAATGSPAAAEGAPAAGPVTAQPGTSTPAAPGAAATGPAEPRFDEGTLPEVVARLDGKPVNRAELLERAAAIRSQMASMGAPPPPQSEEFYRTMLDQLVGAKLLLAEARRRGLAPSDTEVTAAIARLKAGDPEGFARQLQVQGVTEQTITANLAHDMAIRKLVEADVTPAVKVTEEAARNYYQQNLQRMKHPDQVRVRHILIGAGQDGSAEQRRLARQKAEELLARLRGGADFAALARESSDDPGSAGNGGLLPWLGPGESVKPFDEAAFALKPGELSGVVESPFGFHILRLEERRAAGAVSFEEARPHIEQALARQQARTLLEQKVAALRKTARVEVLF
jgi:peptidyl-prolyl cis-trans isomerase C